MHINIGSISFTLQSGMLVPLLLMLPNVVWMLFPKAETGEQKSVSQALEIIENVARVAVMLIPFFYALDIHKRIAIPIMVGMVLVLMMYYACWIRYFAGGSASELFAAPFLGIPLPMAVLPVVFFILSSYLMTSWWMFGASVLFGIAHIRVSAISL